MRGYLQRYHELYIKCIDMNDHDDHIDIFLEKKS